MVPSSLYLGFAASIIWVGQGTYLTSAANSHANDNNLPERTVVGQFNGLFWGMFASHQLVGNLVNLAVLRDGTGGSTCILPYHCLNLSSVFTGSWQTDFWSHIHHDNSLGWSFNSSFCFTMATAELRCNWWSTCHNAPSSLRGFVGYWRWSTQYTA